jgi:asparagine synthase (glutamine-hydrolysing)
MARRGPDARGVFRAETPDGGRLLLLHTRLGIIDLDPRSNQPFADGPLVLAFNGEIYNYLELRRELEACGETWRTDSDTEVLARILRREGQAGLDRCEGMWALAAYSHDTGELLLSRDRFGEKPLYLLDAGHGLYFGSEPKFLVALSGRQPAPDIRHLRRYLVNGYKSLYKQPATFFQGVTEVGAGTVMRAAAGGQGKVSRYWTPAFRPEPDMTYEEAVARSREALIRSVGLRLRADVPLAFCMSGGVDSNTLIATARRVFGHDVHGFTIVNTDARYEESELVDSVVAALDIRHTAIGLRQDGFLDGLRTLVRQHDAPVYTITYYVHWLLMESVRAHGYKIALSGTAADELFTGYYDHHAFYLRQVRDDPALFAKSLDAWRSHIAPVVRNPLLQNPEVFIRDPGERRHIYLDADLFAGYLRDRAREAFFEERYCDDLLRNRMLNELFHEATPVILHEDDLNAMYFSVENRSPFLDRNLFELCFSIPTRHLIRDGAAKAVLRDAMRGIVPDPILDNRRKVGFNAPILDLLDVSDQAVRQWLLGDGPIFDHVRREAIAALLERTSLANSHSKFLFNFVNAKMFLEEFGS